eukprot:11400938-Alexandrium_andersonii.AAC.1
MPCRYGPKLLEAVSVSVVRCRAPSGTFGHLLAVSGEARQHPEVPETARNCAKLFRDVSGSSESAQCSMTC